ncbi:D-alanine--D-alanine ligase [Pseudohongiella nitratireducens]|uniref:D-alanine--D-alanine ligase n=1 Tax=Pseudohongiella nitratireducens TaxID=1768907 RepID=UPI0030EE14EE|tara:strand:- start:1119 stop:2066 length:948 start_codon:yes stop_codon:yes gene_type:complete
MKVKKAVFHDAPEKYGRVAVLLGGDSAEREVSLLSGEAVLQGLLDMGVDAFAIDAGKDLIDRLQSEKIDRVFNVLHGRGGEDGVLQGLLEYMGIPYTGSGVLASALAMDKVKTKLIWQQHGLPTPGFSALTVDTDFERLIAELESVVVKPSREGSSIGMSIVDDAVALENAFATASEYDADVMAEQRIVGPEFTVPFIGDQVLPAIQLQTTHQFYDYDAKYIADDTQYLCPAPLSEAKQIELEHICRQAFTTIGASGWGRIDVMQDDSGRFWLLELNTVPGMTSHSLVPISAKVAGLEFGDLVLKILDTSLEKLA